MPNSWTNSESQSAFVPGRHITDNALLAFEIFHMMKLNKAIDHGVFAFKLHMAKAYDRVEWGFLRFVMLRLGFKVSFVDLILRCVTSVSFRVLVNGYLGTQFELGRRLHQGDPMSPFIFLFCAKALSGMLRRAETQKLLHGARICRTAPRVSHLLFADDCIIFGMSNMNEIDVVKGIIRAYEGVSGQLVNLDKSSISFSGGVLEVKKVDLSIRLGVNRTGAGSTYLGIPSTIGRSEKENFQMLIDRTRKKTKDWKRIFLSGAGKMILIQSVLQSIPTYLMSCFALSAQVCQQLNNVAARFFWGQKEDERRIHWLSWTKLCQTKRNGGLGFRDISLFNQAMLAKQAWRLILHDKSLLARSLKARYFPRNDILLASNAHNPSYAWKSILSEGIAWKIGNGARVRIGLDSWLPDEIGHFFRRGLSWERIDKCIQPEDSWKFQAQIPIHPNNSDRPFWPKGKFNMYSVKSGYLLVVEIKQRDEASTSRQVGVLWKWVWSLEVIPKVKMFLWKCLSNCLPTAMALRGRGIDVDGFCRRCGLSEETLQPLEQEESIVHWFEKIRACPQREVHALFATLAWTIRHSAASLDCDGDSVCKVTSDAALRVGVGAGLGAVVKRGDGAMLGCRFGFKSGVFSALEGEAFALLEGLILRREKGVREVIAETDCQHLYWMLARKDRDLSYLGDTLDKIQELKSQFHRLDFSWTPREGNSIADSIACFALSSLSCFSSHDVIPAGVNSFAG
ncbi:uncharacterized protein LOC131026138 [Salvia miltiorrhiza]|uniref:uncharacterized protein LOC131026138 n=1 Tax=Salvia miltiorrhiza TaxID=226208 RepID=UPI0025AC56A1|nr:uncharacterized protein LOC131026138 [Salvia miltiorrhiza]